MAQAVGQVGPRRNKLVDHVGIGRAEKGFRRQNQHHYQGCQRQGCGQERGNSAGARVKNHWCAMLEELSIGDKFKIPR